MTELLVSIAGAFIGAFAAFGFTLRAQKRQLKAEIENTARLEVIAAINESLVWLHSIGLHLLELQRVVEEELEDDLESVLFDLKKSILTGRPSDWALRLEEYGNVFPYTRTVRIQLGVRYMNLSNAIVLLDEHITQQIIDTSARQFVVLASDKDLFRITEVKRMVDEQHSLLVNLMRHLQNRSLGGLFGNEQPVPDPPNPVMPYLKTSRNGDFQIIEPYKPDTYSRPANYRFGK